MPSRPTSVAGWPSVVHVYAFGGELAEALDLTDPQLEELVTVDDGRAVLTPTGRLLANGVAIRPRADTPVDLARRIGGRPHPRFDHRT